MGTVPTTVISLTTGFVEASSIMKSNPGPFFSILSEVKNIDINTVYILANATMPEVKNLYIEEAVKKIRNINRLTADGKEVTYNDIIKQAQTSVGAGRDTSAIANVMQETAILLHLMNPGSEAVNDVLTARDILRDEMNEQEITIAMLQDMASLMGESAVIFLNIVAETYGVKYYLHQVGKDFPPP